MVQLYGIRLLDEAIFDEIEKLFCGYLPQSTCNKASRFKFHAGRQRQLLGELIVRALICKNFNLKNSNIHFDYLENGKPVLQNDANIHFNISHSGSWVVCAFAQSQVGVDVEKVRNVNFDIARRFFSEYEVKQLFALPLNEQTEFFFDLWTLKESYLKAIGTGLTKSLGSFTVKHVDKEVVLYDGDEKTDVFLKKIGFDSNHKLAVCSFEPEISPVMTQLFIHDFFEMFQY